MDKKTCDPAAAEDQTPSQDHHSDRKVESKAESDDEYQGKRQSTRKRQPQYSAVSTETIALEGNDRRQKPLPRLPPSGYSVLHSPENRNPETEHCQVERQHEHQFKEVNAFQPDPKHGIGGIVGSVVNLDLPPDNIQRHDPMSIVCHLCPFARTDSDHPHTACQPTEVRVFDTRTIGCSVAAVVRFNFARRDRPNDRRVAEDLNLLENRLRNEEVKSRW